MGKYDHMTANEVKNSMLAYFRFHRGYPYIATEYLDCDVVTSEGRNFIEVEVKVSWHDYLQEWKKDKHTNSHRNNRGPIEFGFIHRYNPNRRYFAAPPELAERIAEDLATRCPEYGVFQVWPRGQVISIRKAKARHKEPIPFGLLSEIVARASSELITLRRKVRAV